jgi:hypothetical protein
MEKISTLKTPQEVIGLVKIPMLAGFKLHTLKKSFRWCLMAYRIPVIWVPLSALPTGLALLTYYLLGRYG